MVVASTVFSSFVVLISIITVLTKLDPQSFLMKLLFLSCICIIIANLLLFWDVAISLRALKLEIDYSLNVLKRTDNEALI